MNIVAQCCGVVIMFVLLYFYVSQSKLKLYTSRAFMGIWNITMISLIFDILSIIAIANEETWPSMLVQFLCRGYLASLSWAAFLMLRYVCIDALMTNTIKKHWLLPLYGAGILDMILYFVLPMDIYHKGALAYTDGPAIHFLYLVIFILFGVIAFMMIRHKKAINPRRRKGITVWCGLLLLASMIQFFFGEYLLVSFAGTVGMLYVFLILENPEVYLDRQTGLFNLTAFFEYMRQYQDTKKQASILCISYDNNSHVSISYEVEQEIYNELISFMKDIPRGTVFRSSSTEFIVTFDQEEYAEAAIRLIEKRFERSWSASDRMLTFDWFLLVSTREVQGASDILPIIQYGRQNRLELATNEGLRITDEIVREMYHERAIETEVISALAEDRVEVFYQPIYSTKDKVFTCAEALVRIRDVDGNIIPPNEFIPISERRGLIIRLGERVFENVCKLIVEKDPVRYGLQYIEVNLSVIQCAYEKLADDFIEIMRRYKVDPKYIVLEITESASIREKETLLENMRKLKEVGVRFALDDFGTGQSNLNYIVDMPVDVVKFDSSMTNAYFENGTAKYVMDAAMQMIQGMDLEIVSEGIEEKEQYHIMKDLGIDYIQGYYFSKPVTSDQFIDFIRQKSEE